MSKVNFTSGRVTDFQCPAGKPQAFLWDAKAHGLALRVTSNGARAYVFQSRLNGASVRLTIGDPSVWSIPEAQAEARRLQGLLDQGRDPRIEKAATVAKETAERVATRAVRLRLETSGLDAWAVYIADRRGNWKERTYLDHVVHTAAGGEKRKRSELKTVTGVLYPLLAMPLGSIDGEAVHAWAVRETKRRPTAARYGYRMLRAFLNWCGEHPDYRVIANLDACKNKKAREKLGKPNARSDSLQKEQLESWFTHARADANLVIAAFLQCLLLTGARREEVMDLRWEDIDFKWKTIRISDKVEGERQIPLTPYVAHLLNWLPKRNEWVFSSPTSASGRLMSPRKNLMKVVHESGLPHLTFHGLRRSFGTLSEWVDCPVGVAAQIQGHKPSAIAEKHYRVRPIDLLRMWHERIESFILENAKVEFTPDEEAVVGLKAVTTGTAARKPSKGRARSAA
ncbi:integrase family protein [soil metagenome]